MASKVMVSFLFSDVLETVKEKISKLQYHLLVRNEQYKIYNNLKLPMPENVTLHIDYAEIWEEAAKSTYFGHISFSIFTATAYISFDGITKKQSIVIISEAEDHSQITSHSCFLKAIERSPLDILLWTNLVLSIFIFGMMVALLNFDPSLYFS